jgi:hypothetical protein
LYISSSMTSEPLSPDVIPRGLWLGSESRHPALWHVISAAFPTAAQACSGLLTYLTTWSGSYLRIYVYIYILRSALLVSFLVCGSLEAAAAGHLVSSHLQPPQLPGVPALSPQRGGRDHLSVLYITAPSVACSLSRSLISEKGDTVLFEGSSLWNLANVGGG